MITSQHICNGWVNVRGVIQAKGNGKCKCYGCPNPVSKGDNVVKLSSGNLCSGCSSLALQTVEARYRRELGEIKDLQKQLRNK